MTPTSTTDEWGIDASWLDALDEEHTVSQATINRLREVIGTPPADLEDRAPIVARPPPSSVSRSPAAASRRNLSITVCESGTSCSTGLGP